MTSKIKEDKIVKLLKEIQRRPDNKMCADCTSKVRPPLAPRQAAREPREGPKTRARARARERGSAQPRAVIVLRVCARGGH
jgi:hypothetical protein